jgi:hypothetical protein
MEHWKHQKKEFRSSYLSYEGILRCSWKRNETAADASREHRKWWRHAQLIFAIRNSDHAIRDLTSSENDFEFNS